MISIGGRSLPIIISTKFTNILRPSNTIIVPVKKIFFNTGISNKPTLLRHTYESSQNPTLPRKRLLTDHFNINS